MRWKPAFAALAAILSCGGWIHGYSLPTFIGNPNATVASIGTTTITASRASGELPAFVQVSASAVTATGTMANGTTLNAYEDLDYYWDFGDPTGTENFTNYANIPNTSANANFQIGPEAAYVYRSAGTYTIRLTIRGCASPPVTAGSRCTSFSQATSTTTFIASAFDKSGGEFWADSNAGGTNAGTLANPFTTIAAINTAISASHIAINLKCNSNWVGSTGIAINRSDIRIRAYSGAGVIGSCPRGTSQPIVNIQNGVSCSGSPGSTCNALSSTNTSRATSNIVVSNVDFWRSGTTVESIINFLNSNTTNHADDIYFDNINVVSDVGTGTESKWLRFQYAESAGGTYPNATNVQRTGMWGGSFNQGVNQVNGEIGYYGGARYWNFFVGMSPFTGNGCTSAPNLCHHIYPNQGDHTLFRWNNFGTGVNRNFALDSNCNTQTGSYMTCNYWLVSENMFTGTFNGVDASNGTGANNNFLSDFANFVVQKNSFTNLSVSAQYFGSAISMTTRYNNAWGMPGTGTYPLVQVNATVPYATAVEMGINFKMYGWNIYQTTVGSQTSGRSPINQKVQEAAGTGTWSNGSGGSGTVLNVATASGTITNNGQMLLVAEAVPQNATVAFCGPGGGCGTGGAGLYTMSQSALSSTNASIQFVLGWTTPWTITDNAVQDNSATCNLMDLQFVKQAAATVDRNQWYGPNCGLATAAGVGTPFFNNRFSQTFTQLKAAGSPVLFSIHDIVSQPSWPNPAIGQFNYLLKRDLDPASNDNDPMWTEKAA